MKKSPNQLLTNEQLKQAREWISECVWGDLDELDIDNLSDEQIILGIKRHFSGGIPAFIESCN